MASAGSALASAGPFIPLGVIAYIALAANARNRALEEAEINSRNALERYLIESPSVLDQVRANVRDATTTRQAWADRILTQINRRIEDQPMVSYYDTDGRLQWGYTPLDTNWKYEIPPSADWFRGTGVHITSDLVMGEVERALADMGIPEVGQYRNAIAPVTLAAAEWERMRTQGLDIGGGGGYAAGGVFDTRGPTQITVGEAGTETVAVVRNPRREAPVFPRQGGEVVPAGDGRRGMGGATIHVTVNVAGSLIGAGSRQELARTIAAELRDLDRRISGPGLFPRRP